MNKPENSTLLNICIIPDERVSTLCAEISQSFKGEHTMFVLGQGFFAHMTVYMARFAEESIKDVVGATGRALTRFTPFDCEHVGYFMTEGRYLEVSYRKSNSFMQLHNTLIENLADLRINPGMPYEEDYFAPYTAEQRHNAEETGYDLARNLYRPHVTLTRYNVGEVPSAFPAFPAANLSFPLSKVCVYKADDNGAVYEKLAEFAIK